MFNSRYYFILDGKHSHEDYNIIVSSGPPYVISKERVTHKTVGGKNGSLTIKEGIYDDIVLPFKIRILSKNSYELYEKIDEIITWLTEAKTLIYDRHDVYYNVKEVDISDGFLNELIMGAESSINIVCEPFKYTCNEDVITINKPTNLLYTGTHRGECNIKIYATGNIQLTINSETIEIKNVENFVELDSKLELCLNSDKTSKSRDFSGNWLTLVKGNNNISWVGNVQKIDILPRTAFK